MCRTKGLAGENNWLEGVQLLSVDAVLGILFYFLPEVQTAVETLAPHH
ncbi:MAG: hypothetical protein IPJ30_26310 [Acidobacteria bacterium]|nr:hypothetical protein [Acidobacteriota bacterium]